MKTQINLVAILISIISIIPAYPQNQKDVVGGMLRSNILSGGTNNPVTLSWNDQHIFYLISDFPITAEFMDPGSNPITETNGIIWSRIWKGGSVAPISVAWNDDHIYYLHTHSVGSEEFEDPGNNPITGIHGT